MKRFLATILFLGLALTACKKDDSSSSSSGFDILNSDDTKEVIELIGKANEDLNKVKAIYKTNQNRVDEELLPAMSGRDFAKAKEIANDLVLQINDGLSSADDAVKKIEQAEDMNINETYKEYLGLKKEALKKQIQAFQLRHKVAKLIRDSMGGNDPVQINQAKSEFMENEKKFQALMDEGKVLSEKANQIYKDSLKK